MSGHTPGPWSFGKRGKTTQHIDGGHAVPNEGWWGLAKVYVVVDDEPSETGDANARLIAAAPELLEAVKAMIEWDDREQDHFVDFNVRMDLCKRAFDLARAAIAKATGEGA